MKKGIAQAEHAASSGYVRQPRVRLKNGDRARFWFLSNGEDDFFAGGRFHMFEQQTQSNKTYTREVLCLRAYSDGEDSCPLCEEGHDNFGNRFAVWIYLDFILHTGDNPSQEEGEEPWAQVKVGKRVMFKEDVKEPLMIWMPYGKQWAWFGQFREALTKYGTLTGRLYELKRSGSGMQDTDYLLTPIKEEDIPKSASAAVDKSEVFGTIDQAFRETLTAGAAPKPTRLSEHLPPKDGSGEEEEKGSSNSEQEIPELEEGGEELV